MGCDNKTELQMYYDVYDRQERILNGRIHNADIDL